MGVGYGRICVCIWIYMDFTIFFSLVYGNIVWPIFAHTYSYKLIRAIMDIC